MALSDEQISKMWSDAHNDTSDYMAYQVLAKAIETEVRKQDDALILQLVEALDDLTEAGEDAWSEERPCVRIGKEVATAGRARLEGKP